MKNKNIYCVYKYQDNSNHTNKVYIGLTKDLNRRDREHRNRKERDTVFKSFDIIPEPVVLKDNLTQDEAIFYECYYVELYKSMDGVSVINKVKPGGTGGNYIIWTKEKCMQEAKKYRYVKQLRENNQWVYKICLKNNWIEEFGLKKTIIKPKWTYEVLKLEAIKYSSRKEFRKKASHAFEVCKKNGWLDELMPKKTKY